MGAVANQSFNRLNAGLETAADRALSIIWTANADGEWTYVNPAWTVLTGQRAPEALGLAWLEMIPQEDRERVQGAYLDGVAGAEPFDLIHGLRSAAAGWTAVRTHVSPEFRNDNQLVGFVGSSIESEATRVADEGMGDQEFRSLVENSPDIVARLDADLRYLYVNRAVQAAFGIEAAAVIGKTLPELGVSDHIVSEFTRVAREVLELGEERFFDFTTKSGSHLRYFSARMLPERTAENNIGSVLAIIYDVTQRMLAQMECDALLIREQAARVQAEAAAKARDQFLAIVSHELRSPLNGIQSWTHVLENRVGSASPPVERAIAGIKTGVQQQVRLIADLLDATQVMTGKLRFVKEPFLLRPAVEAAIESVAREALERNVTIRASFPDEHIHLLGNAERIEQIMWNLLTNAIKFSLPGAAVDVAVEEADAAIRISVKDTGKGITADFMPYLFDPFRQADGSNTRRTEGLGLGLTLVQRLAELHGGVVTAHSDGENMGATFSVRLPLIGQAAVVPDGTDVPKAIQADQINPLTSLANVRVLLVDDQKEARDSLAELLRQTGADVMSFESGPRAVDYLGVVGKGGVPHVIVCDIAMPEQDGYITLQQIRRMERQEPDRFRVPIPAVALTAFDQREHRLQALASGFQVYLVKPANPSELVTVIEMLTRQAVRSEQQGGLHAS